MDVQLHYEQDFKHKTAFVQLAKVRTETDAKGLIKLLLDMLANILKVPKEKL